MFYCPNCNNIYDITKNIPQQNITGGANIISDTPETISSITGTITENNGINIQNIVDYILNNNNINIDNLHGYNISDIQQSDYYKKLPPKSKNIISTRLTQLEKSTKNKESAQLNAYFICKNCGNHESIKPNTLIIRKNYIDTEVNDEINMDQYKNMMAVKCLPITRNYICHNKKCESHDNPSKRMAKFYRITGSFKIRYICLTCNDSWTA